MQDDCSLIDGYALVVQFVVGLCAISTLVIKRQWETPQRSWLVWFFDASKQALAAGAMHFINVLASTISGDVPDLLQQQDDPCVWYLAFLLVDGTLLVTLMAILLKTTDWFVVRRGLATLRHGEYGDPPRLSIWMQQLTLYALLLFSAKAVCLWVLNRHKDFFVGLAGWILTPVIDHRRVELVAVMMIFPLFTSTFQYWVIDQLIKADWDCSLPNVLQLLPGVGLEEDDEPDDGSKDSITARRDQGRVYRDLASHHGLESSLFPLLTPDDHAHDEDDPAS